MRKEVRQIESLLGVNVPPIDWREIGRGGVPATRFRAIYEQFELIIKPMILSDTETLFSWTVIDHKNHREVHGSGKGVNVSKRAVRRSMMGIINAQRS